MNLDWEVIGVKAAISSSFLWVLIFIRKKIVPFFKESKKFLKLTEISEHQGKRISLNNSYRKAMWDVLKDPIFTTNIKGEVTYINPAYSKLVGTNDPRDVYGFNYMNLIPEEDRIRVERNSKTMTDHPGTPFDGIVRLINQQTGAMITTECRSAPVYEEDVFVGNLGRLYVLKIEPAKIEPEK